MIDITSKVEYELNVYVQIAELRFMFKCWERYSKTIPQRTTRKSARSHFTNYIDDVSDRSISNVKVDFMDMDDNLTYIQLNNTLCRMNTDAAVYVLRTSNAILGNMTDRVTLGVFTNYLREAIDARCSELLFELDKYRGCLM